MAPDISSLISSDEPMIVIGMSEPDLITRLSGEKFFGSQTKLAEVVGVRPHTICEKKDSKNPLTYTQMVLILEKGPELGVNITPDDFFPGVNFKAKPQRKRAA
jgi:hypothetical protein